ncbi:MAG TPA: hypothetical protein VGF55_15975 [Gemmataceae bacterium]
MAIKLRCPTCGAKLKAPDAAAGRPLDCPHCAQAVPVPSVAASPPPAVAGPGESAGVEGRRRPVEPHMAPNPRVDALIDAYEDRRAHQRAEAVAEDESIADRIGFVGLMLAAASAACLVMGMFTCGITYWLAAPVALAGAGCSVFSHSRLKVVGLVVNLLILAPGVVTFKTAWTAVTAPAPEPKPFLP